MRKRGNATTVLHPAQGGRNIGALQHQSRPQTYWFSWRHLRFKLTETPDSWRPGAVRLELDAIAARDTPVPVTATGYLAVTIDSGELAAAGGAIAVMTAQLDQAAATKAYQAAEFRWRQGDLLDRLALEDDREA